jgi:hypothetical protein
MSVSPEKVIEQELLALRAMKILIPDLSEIITVSDSGVPEDIEVQTQYKAMARQLPKRFYQILHYMVGFPDMQWSVDSSFTPEQVASAMFTMYKPNLLEQNENHTVFSDGIIYAGFVEGMPTKEDVEIERNPNTLTLDEISQVETQRNYSSSPISKPERPRISSKRFGYQWKLGTGTGEVFGFTVGSPNLNHHLETIILVQYKLPSEQ